MFDELDEYDHLKHHTRQPTSGPLANSLTPAVAGVDVFDIRIPMFGSS